MLGFLQTARYTVGRFPKLLLHKDQFAKPKDYYRKTYPAEAAETAARRQPAKLEAR